MAPLSVFGRKVSVFQRMREKGGVPFEDDVLIAAKVIRKDGGGGGRGIGLTLKWVKK
jgi:hypothetical protein